MKNYLKKQAKKSLSLFLAVLMLLSCWVWIAPEKAEAADHEDGYYYVEVWGRISDTCSAGLVTNDWRIAYKENNGLGTEHVDDRTQLTSSGIDGKTETPSGSEVKFAYGWVPGWPTRIYGSIVSSGSGCDQDEFTLADMEVRVQKIGGGMVSLHPNDGKFTTGNATSQNIDYWAVNAEAPTATSIGDMSESVSVDVPALGSGTTKTSTYIKPKVYDQYGVRMLTTAPSGFYVADASGNKIGTNSQADGAWATVANDGYSAAVTVNENIQKVITSTTGKATISLAATAGSSVNYQTITLNYPSYTVSVNADGRTGSTTKATIKMNSGSDFSGSWSTSGTYSSQPTPYPTGVATKQGYTFKGFWTNQQPTTGDASINALEADFATPVSTDEYNTYAAKEGATVSNGIVTLSTGEKYCDGGTKWKDGEALTINGAEEYYGWWVSTDITAKFYNIDGSYLGTKTYKYGQTGSQVEWPEPLSEYNAGAYEYKTFANVWQDISGIKVSESTYVFGTDDKLELILTPTYTTKTYKDTYTVNFINPQNGNNLTGSGTYAYRHVLGSEIPSNVAVPDDISDDFDYSYEFAGWTDQVPSNSKYHIIADSNTTFAFNTDWVVREDKTYYPVFRSTVRKYVVQFTYIDSTGASVTKIENVDFGAVIKTPDYVNTTYASGGMGYELQGWTYISAASQNVQLGKDDTLALNNTNVQMAANNRADGVDEQAIVFTAVYDDGTPMPYNVTFKFKNEKGEDDAVYAQVYNKEYITQDTVDLLSVPATYDDGTAQYTFANKWKVTEGVAAKDEYTKDELTSFSPTSHVTFEAVYSDGVPFYTVTYVDGTATQSYRVLKGDNVPAWTYKNVNDNNTPDNTEDDYEEDVVYVPKDYESDTGTYRFAGWFDEKQTDTTYQTTNGTKYTTADAVTDDITLYAQYEFEPFKFTITFWNYDKTVQLGSGEFEYGQSFAHIFAQANKAAQYRAPDETYTYEFIGWDQPYDEDHLVCEGKDVDYVAQYKPSYIYYNANWYNSEDDMNNKTEAADGSVVGLLATTHHTYEGKVYAPSVKTTAPSDAPVGKSYVFAGWYYKDADGAEHAFTRGMAIKADMDFYATYTLVTEAHTVTTVVDGKSTEYKVADGETAKAVPTPGDTYVDETTHKNFVTWYTTADYAEGTEFNIDKTAITSSITIYAKFDKEEHSKTNKELISAPTYYAKGSEKIWCSCDREKTEETAEIAMLTDTVAPTGTIYLGTQGKWSSTETDPTKTGAGDTNKYYANADTDIILTLNDTGDVNSAYNPAGVGKGIKNIRAFVTTGTFDVTDITAATKLAITIYPSDGTVADLSETQNNTANYVFKVEELKYGTVDANGDVVTQPLVDGDEYIIFYYAIDKAGNELNKNVRTAKFRYDNTAPVFTVEGTGNAGKVAGTPTYCKTATVTGIEDDATVTVNGTVVEATDGKYVINTAGNYIITVTDKAGNATSKKIAVAADHTKVTVEKAATCEEDGYKKVTCAICDATISTETIKSEGHKWVAGTAVAATCENEGYTPEKCSVCGETRKTNVTAALGHNYAKDENGNIIYTVVTKATCKAEGKEIANCTNCGGETLTQTIPVDEVNGHVYGGVKTLKATCTDAGKYYQSCKYCYKVKDGDTIPATGHKETYKVVTTAATCGLAGVETEKCKKCDAVIGTSEIAATGKHIVYTVDSKAPTATEKGYIEYGCRTCTWTKTEEIDTLELYTVTFVGEDGTTIATLADKVVGTTITEDDVTEPTKAADNTYTYKFAGWVEVKEDGTTGDAVKLPFDVSKDITLKATFSQATIIYTHKFMVPTKWTALLGTESEGNVEFATIIGAYGDTDKKPVAEPNFTDADENVDAYLKSIYTFKFIGWSTTGAVGDIVTDFTIAGDATFYAVFMPVSIVYDVIFYNGTTPVWTTTVNGGETVEFGGTEPTKAFDADYHYAFNTWYSDEGLKNEFSFDTPITSKTRLYAGFTAEEHDFVAEAEDERTPATCTEAEKIDEACSCGATRVTNGEAARGHIAGESKQETVDGVIYNVTYCGREGCGVEISRTKTSVSVAFKNENGVRLDTQNLNLGSAIEYKGETPTKAADKQNTYTFIGWYVEGDEAQTVVDLTTVTATKDIVYVAKYRPETRKYTVSYVSLDNTALQTAEIEYGGKVPAYTGATQTKAADDTYHYLTYTWSVEAGATVESDLIIKPVFNAVKHNYDKEEIKNPTCTEQGGLTKICSACGHSYVSKDIVPATGHNYKLTQRIDPNYATGTDGKEVYTCDKCGDSYTTVISGKKMEVKVTVKDTNGNAKEGVRVSLVYAGTVTVVEGTTDQFTNANGVATFWVVPGKYQALIEGGEQVTGELEAKEDGTVTGNGDVQVEAEKAEGCGCSCHRSNFWGTIFRFFHKIIRFFTGRINCCTDPDSRYF